MNIPDSIQWLLEFANLGCTPGVFTPKRVFAEVDINRPPTKPPPPEKEPLYTTPEVGYLVTGERYNYIEQDGHLWERKEGEQDYHYAGRHIPNIRDYEQPNGFCPSSDEFKNFFSRTGIDQGYDTLIINIWQIACSSLLCKIDFGETNINNRLLSGRELAVCKFVNKQMGWDSPFVNRLQEAIQELWYNHKKLHPHLKQCLCCGRFWIEGKTKKFGRKRIYCSEECKVVFNSASRLTDSKNKKRRTEKRHRKVRDEIIEWLVNNYYEQNSVGQFYHVTEQRAEEIYNSLSKKAKTSMKEFKRIYAIPRRY